MDKLRELREEFQLVVTGRQRWGDSILPPAVFVGVSRLVGPQYAMWSSLVVTALIIIARLRQGDTLRYALGGLGGVMAAIAGVAILDRAEGYFLPGIITGVLTISICLASVAVRRPLVAWTSHVARGWPREWYWHPKVRPAYSEVTGLWIAFFGARLLLQYALFQDRAVQLLAVVNVVSGWPATVALLAISYLYGTWRLRNLSGPSVEEFVEESDPPWEGQKRGF